jgi:hypothetical protein
MTARIITSIAQKANTNLASANFLSIRLIHREMHSVCEVPGRGGVRDTSAMSFLPQKWAPPKTGLNPIDLASPERCLFLVFTGRDERENSGIVFAVNPIRHVPDIAALM